MPDAALRVSFSNNAQRMAFVQGEDRVFPVVITDASSAEPIDLTGATLEVCFPRQGGGTVRRTTGPVVTSAALITATGVFAATSHGLVTGDTVTAAAPGGSLPTGLAPGAYQVRVISVDTFALQTGGADAIPTAPGSGLMTLTNTADLVIDVGTLGHANLTLPARVTAAVRDGSTQDMQVNVTIAGKRRIVVLKDALDVWEQADP